MWIHNSDTLHKNGPDHTLTLKERLVRLVRARPRYDYRRFQVLVEREGEPVNHKRLYRVYREAGLCLKRKKRIAA